MSRVTPNQLGDDPGNVIRTCQSGARDPVSTRPPGQRGKIMKTTFLGSAALALCLTALAAQGTLPIHAIVPLDEDLEAVFRYLTQ